MSLTSEQKRYPIYHRPDIHGILRETGGCSATAVAWKLFKECKLVFCVSTVERELREDPLVEWTGEKYVVKPDD